MMARTTSIIMQSLVEIARLTSAWEDEMWCFSLCLFVCFENNALRPSTALVRSWVTSTIHSLHHFCGRTFQRIEQFLKLSRWRYDWCPNDRKNWKSEKMGAVCAHHFDHLISEVNENYHSILSHVGYCRCTRINIFASSLQGTTINFQVRTGGTKSAR